MSVHFIKLINSDDVVADIIEDNTYTLTLNTPCKVVYFNENQDFLDYRNHVTVA